MLAKFDPGGNSVVETYVFNKDGTIYSGNWPVQRNDEMIYGNVAASAPMIANLDGSDDELEIIVLGIGNTRIQARRTPSY